MLKGRIDDSGKPEERLRRWSGEVESGQKRKEIKKTRKKNEKKKIKLKKINCFIFKINPNNRDD